MTEGTQLPGSGVYVRRGVVAMLGVLLLAVPVVVVLLVVGSFSGNFGSFVVVNADLPLGANAPGLQSPVQYRDVTVGTVASQGRPLGGGQVSIVLHLQPAKMSSIPAGVQATVAPLSVFGNQYVDLLQPGSDNGSHLRAGQTIGAVPVRGVASLQGTVADLDGVLTAIHPAQLDAILTNLATALRDQGRSLGQTFSRASVYLGQMVPLLPTVESDLNLLSPVANQVAASTPSLLSIFSNLTVTSHTLVTNQTQLHQAFVGGATVAGQSTDLLTAIQLPWDQLIADSGPLLADVSQNPNEIAQVLQGLDTWSKAWSSAESQGPYLSLSSNVSVPNAADLVLASLGSPNADALFAQGIGPSLVNPPTYTAAQCPSYGSMSGTACGGSSTPAPGTLLGSATVLPEPEQQHAVSTVTTALDHGRAPSSPAVATLLLGPLFRHMVSGS